LLLYRLDSKPNPFKGKGQRHFEFKELSLKILWCYFGCWRF